MAGEHEVRLDSVLESRQPPLLEPGRRTAPETECALERARRRFRVTCGELLSSLAYEKLETVEVELALLDTQRIPGRLRDQAVGAERLP